jgi:hypothetical protein
MRYIDLQDGWHVNFKADRFLLIYNKISPKLFSELVLIKFALRTINPHLKMNQSTKALVYFLFYILPIPLAFSQEVSNVQAQYNSGTINR